MRRIPRPPFSPVRNSLRAKVTIGILIPLLLLLGLITAAQLSQHRKVVLQSAALIAGNAGKVVEESLLHEITESHFESAQSLLDAIGGTGVFRVVYLLDTEGAVLFAPEGIGIGDQLSNEHEDCRACHDLDEDERPSSVVVKLESGERVFRSMVPMENSPQCIECHPDDGEPLALLLTDTPMTPLEASLAVDFWENLLWLVAAIAITVLVVNLALSELVLKRIQKLSSALAGFSPGSDEYRLATGEPDEIGNLASVYNEMGERVAREQNENRKLSEHLRQQSALRGELLKRLVTAQEDERQRLAREIHDEVGQSLSGLALQLEVLQRYLHPQADQMRVQVSRIQELVASASDSMYDLIFDLRPAALDDLGLPAALRTLADRTLANTRITFEIDSSGFEGRLPTEMETAIYRMFQEALNNAVRHASARHIRFILHRDEEAVHGRIEDDGRGFNPAEIDLHAGRQRGLGLAGMRERINQFGGHLEIDSSYGAGTRIAIHIPFGHHNDLQLAGEPSS